MLNPRGDVMTEPTVSVVMMAYNAERFARQAIESILNQTYTDFELLIIDDGSTDGSPGIFREYARRDARVRIHTQPRNLGIANARNMGLQLARGKYMAVMDADDVSLPERLARQVAYLDAYPEIGVLGAGAWLIDENGQRQGGFDYPLSHNLVYWSLCFYDPIINPVVMLRTELARAVGGYRAEFLVAQDYDLWARLSSQTCIENLPERLLLLRKHGQNITTTKRLLTLERSAAISRDLFRRLLGVDLPVTPIELAWEPRKIREAELGVLVNAILALREYFFHRPGLTLAEKSAIRRETALQLFRLARNANSTRVAVSTFYRAFSSDPLAVFPALRLALLKIKHQ